MIAYVVLAHHQPALCRRLIHALASGTSRVFVHVDARVDEAPFRIERSEAVFLRKRIAVNRGGWSLTAAMAKGLEAAYTGSDARYFVFLAGTDYPIRSAEQIHGCLRERYPTNFINFYPMLPGSSGLANLLRYHFVDQAYRLERLLGGRRDANDREAPFERLTARLNEWLPARTFPPEAIPFRGSDRWCLNRGTVEHILRHWNGPEGKAYRRYFSISWGSDEMFFQTVVFNSPWAEQCAMYDSDTVQRMITGELPAWKDEVRPYFHYIDWDPAREDPAVLDERDFAQLQATPRLFACKFLESKSGALLDRIDRELRGA
jgi:hypothetical protein